MATQPHARDGVAREHGLAFAATLYYSARIRVDTLGGNAVGLAQAPPQFSSGFACLNSPYNLEKEMP